VDNYSIRKILLDISLIFLDIVILLQIKRYPETLLDIMRYYC